MSKVSVSSKRPASKERSALESTNSLDEYDKLHMQAMEKYDSENKMFRIETQINRRVNEMMLPMSKRMQQAAMLIDQLIINVDKHEN